MIPEAERLATTLPKPLHDAFARCYTLLADEGHCGVYVKTIYVGFSLGAEMVAAFYPRANCIEIALALPEDIEGPEFNDATHLTWPTMPVSIEVTDAESVSVAMERLREALALVAEGSQIVRRPNEHFIGKVGHGNSSSRSRRL